MRTSTKRKLMFRYSNQLILKVTRDCNLRCEYCYIKNKDHFKGEMIEFDLFKETIERIIKERIVQQQPDVFNLIFHGGEPTLASKEHMTKMFIYADKRFREEGISYSFGMQSNLTLIDEEWCQMLSRWGVSLGCSFDGVGEDSNNKRTVKEDTFYKKFDMLKKYNVSFGLLMVAHEGNMDSMIKSADFLRDRYGIDMMKVNYIEDVNGVGGEIPGDLFFEKGWKPFLDEWIDKDSGVDYLRESNSRHLITKFFTDYLTHHKNLERSNCGNKVCGGGTCIVEMEADGEFQFCGRYAEMSDESYVMNVKDKDFLSLKQLKRYTDFIYEKHKVIKRAGCDTCIADGICDHGCMAFHFAKFGEWGIRTDLTCDIHKNFYEYCITNVVDILAAAYREERKDQNGEAYIQLSSQAINTKPSFRKMSDDLREKHSLTMRFDEGYSNKIIIKHI